MTLSIEIDAGPSPARRPSILYVYPKGSLPTRMKIPLFVYLKFKAIYYLLRTLKGSSRTLEWPTTDLRHGA